MNEKEKEVNPNLQREGARIFFMVEIDSATSSFLSMIVIKS